MKQGELGSLVTAALAQLPSIAATSPLSAMQQALQALNISVAANISNLPVCPVSTWHCADAAR